MKRRLNRELTKIARKTGLWRFDSGEVESEKIECSNHAGSIVRVLGSRRTLEEVLAENPDVEFVD